ncbi:glycosyltransferase [Leadbettera azotonutricia]|uniref:Glycosyltransferase n=1 Tax=Leadbettera azotonutricia (strain ATCC BAA-888 / DSM 13862 / ZAS-9) TaxID=545695 RepID=F5YAV2_LEAAZ|nr:glycosyltransferase [Leadbettera azotonutricia]AEF82627.1 glycosyltransferase [Leadbettera azotonutricia ZAS-9]
MNSTEKLKRISLLVDSFSEGGAERVMVTLANTYLNWGYQVDFIVIRDIGLYKDQLSKNAKKIVLYNGSHSLTIINRLKRKISVYLSLLLYFCHDSPDVFMVTMRRDNIIASKIYNLFPQHFPLILREADVIVEDEGKEINEMKRWYKKAPFVIANSECTKDDLIKKIKLDKNSIIRIYNPMLLPQNIERAKNKNIRIIGCGRLVAKKNFADLIQVFSLIYNEYPEAELTIIGEGEERTNLEALIKSLNLENAIHMPGSVLNPYDYYSKADVFVQTSLYEGFGYVLPEAMACGTPVVAYDSKGAMREILADGKYGILVIPGDLDSLKKAILKQIISPTPYVLLKEAVERFDKEKICHEYLQVFENAINKNANPN